MTFVIWIAKKLSLLRQLFCHVKRFCPMPGNIDCQKGFHPMPGKYRLSIEFYLVPEKYRLSKDFVQHPGNINYQKRFYIVPGAYRLSKKYVQYRAHMNCREKTSSFETEEAICRQVKLFMSTLTVWTNCDKLIAIKTCADALFKVNCRLNQY